MILATCCFWYRLVVWYSLFRIILATRYFFSWFMLGRYKILFVSNDSCYVLFFDTCLFRDTFCIECKNCADCNFDWNRIFFADDHDHGDGDDSNFRSRPLKEFESRHRQTSRSPGLVVMGDDSCSKGRGFKSLRRILDGHFSHWFVVKIVCLKRPQTKEKRPGLAHLKKILLQRERPCGGHDNQSLQGFFCQTGCHS